MQRTAITWFEIPAKNLDRASLFYTEVIGSPLAREHLGGHEMAVFPYTRDAGVGGCIMIADYLKPGDSSNMIYLAVDDDISAALTRAERAGGRVALGKTALPGDMGHFAHIIDSEGNRIGLHSLQ